MADKNDRLIIPEKYSPILTVKQTENAIKRIKDNFESNLAKELNLSRVSAPLFIKPESRAIDTNSF